ncbi:UDP-galactopyranose mutase [soil metagenome]
MQSFSSSPQPQTYDIIIIGAGISGATLAERYATQQNKKVLLLEKRDHIGGNCYDFYNDDGILVSKYGAHLFHTNFEDVWTYIQQFSKWYPYEHRVKASVDGKLVPVPVNITTVNELFGLQIQNESEMDDWLKKNQIANSHPKNSEEAALARVGPILYEKLFKNYTKKQWNKFPAELDPLVLNRIPVRNNFDDRYFSDIHQALPTEGYTKLFEKMLKHPNITVKLNTDYFENRNSYTGHEKLFYTGAIDQFFDFKHSVSQSLEYRSIQFVWETHNQEQYQNNPVINYPNDYDFTRIVEYKHFTHQKHPKTTISKEISCDFIPGKNEPYYPVPNEKNQAIFELYQQEAENLEEKGVYFVGRLANYKYFNMDQAFKNALDLFNKLHSS